MVAIRAQGGTPFGRNEFGIPQTHLPAEHGYARSNRVAVYCVSAILLSYLFPVEAAVRLGMVLSARRLAILLCLLPIIFYTAWRVRNKRYVPVVSDIAVVFFTIWALYASFVNGGIASVFGITGMTGVELLVPYLAGRMLISDSDTSRVLMNVCLCLAAGLLVLGMVDIVSGQNIIAKMATDAFGNFRSVKFYGTEEVLASGTQYRFGLPRARGSIEHPILFGLFFVALLPFIVYNSRSGIQKLAAFGICIGGTMLALSSAPMLVLTLMLCLMAYDKLFKNIHWRWAFLWMMALLGVGALLVLVEDPIVAFIQGFTLDPATGMTRLRIWHWIGVNLEGSPLFGIGTSDWIRPTDMLSSVDALWLVIAMTYGYVGVGFFILAVIGVFFTINAAEHRTYERPELVGMRFASSLALFVFISSSFTVHLWGAAWGFLGFIMGVRASMTEAPYLPPVGDRPEFGR